MNETWIGLYLGLVANLAAAAVLNNPYQATSRVWLITLGTVNEILGVLLVASPELSPRLPACLGAGFTNALVSFVGSNDVPSSGWPKTMFSSPQ